ncbi:MAG: hypothetical protein KDE31_35490 [Caldilineaceae bacterium]|nr:hypothetical protein [Caldilineaceae bacterium]
MTRVLLVALCLGFFHGAAHAQQWSGLAQISSTMGNNFGRLCVGDKNTDLGCPTYAPSLTTAGHVSVTGNLSAAKFIGDGSGLTNLSVQGDRIISASANVVAGNGGTVSFTTGGVSGTAYIDTAGRFVAAGVSTTGAISATRLFVSFVSASSGLSLVSSTSYLNGSGSGDRIVSTSSNVLAKSDGTIQFTTGAVSSTAYLDTSGRFVGPGVSTTGPISGTLGYFASNTEVRGRVSATTLKLADNPADVCDAASYGTIKVINGSLYNCRQ